MWRLKLSWSSKWIPDSLTDEAISTFPVKNWWCLNCVWMMMDLNLFGVNNYFAIRKPFNGIFGFSNLYFQQQFNRPDKWCGVLLSANLWADAFLMQKKRSFKYALNKIDPTIEPCGTPEIMSLKSPLTLLMRRHCLRFFKNI